MVALEEQVKMFVPNPSAARVILATNMAESSVTLPDVSYVIVAERGRRIGILEIARRVGSLPAPIEKCA
jgi:HrpA-like RNA helicase